MKHEGYITEALQASERMRADAGCLRQELTNMEVEVEKGESAICDRDTPTVALPIFGAIVVHIPIRPLTYHTNPANDLQCALLDIPEAMALEMDDTILSNTLHADCDFSSHVNLARDRVTRFLQLRRNAP